MPELQDEAVVDTLDTETQTEGAGDGSPATGADTEKGNEELFFGKYKTKEEAEKAYKEAERTMSEKAQEAKEYKRRLEEAETQAKLADSISKLAEAQNRPAEEETLDIDAFANDLAENHGIDADAVKKILEVNDSWIRESSKSVAGKQEIEALRSETEQLKAALQEVSGTVVKNQPDYVQNKDIVDGLVEKGMKLSDAIDTAKSIKKQLGVVEQPERINPPASINGSRVASTPPKDEEILTDKEKAEWKADGLTDEDIAKYEQEQREKIDKKLKGI